jgi:predicted ATPase
MPARRQSGRLPAESTSFVGRQAELARLVEVAGMRRFVTVTGVGGVGKTRLVRQAARRLADDYPDGVYLVELSALQVPGLLPAAVGTALGMAGQDARPALDTVTGYLRDRRLLLILDTCEHMPRACGEFARTVIGEAPGVGVLATSRQPLGVPGERTFPVLPLPVPEDGDGPSPGDAVDLFVQRAASAAPGFTLTEENRDEVIGICRRLAGIPLALELAAVRLRTLTVPELVAGFGLDITATSRRTALTRHKDLRTSIGWSYELCTDAERTLWRRISVFAGSSGLDAVTAVCAGGTLRTVDIPEAIEGLVRKSVLIEDGIGYRLLDPIREFGATELDGSGAAAAVRGRHIAHYLGMARGFGRQALAGDQLVRYRQLQGEHANIRAALEHAFAIPGNDRAAIDIATSLFLFWHMSGLAWEGEYWVNRALERCPQPSALRARLLATRAYLLCLLGEITEARTDALTAIKMAERFSDTDTVARGYACLHRALTWSDDLASGSSIADTTVRLLDNAGDTLGLVQFDTQAALAELQARDAHAAGEIAARGLRRLPAGELWGSSYLLGLLSIAKFVTGEQEEGSAIMRRALAMKHELGDVLGVAYGVGVLGLMAAGQQRHERSAWLLGAAETLWDLAGRRYTGNPFLEAWHQRVLASGCESLGPDRFRQLWERGAAAGPDALVLFAAADADAPARNFFPAS